MTSRINYHKELIKARKFATCSTSPDDEEWKPIPIVGWDNIFLVSNYGRIFNTKNASLVSCYLYGDISFRNPYIPSVSNNVKIVSIKDIIRSTFYPEIVNSHINCIFKDGNEFNLKLSNLEFVKDEFYIGDDSYKDVPILIENIDTGYRVDVNGIVTTPKGNKILRKNYITLKYKKDRVKVEVKELRSKILANAFIPNPHDLMHEELIIKPSPFYHYGQFILTSRDDIKKEIKEIYKDLKEAGTFIVKPDDPEYSKFIGKPLFTTVKNIRRTNRFSYVPIKI